MFEVSRGNLIVRENNTLDFEILSEVAEVEKSRLGEERTQPAAATNEPRPPSPSSKKS